MRPAFLGWEEPWLFLLSFAIYALTVDWTRWTNSGRMPAEFEAVAKAITGAANCVGCRHSHYLQARGQDDEDRIETNVSEVRA